MPSQVGYWGIRGIGQPIRLLLAYVGEDFEDVTYELGDGPEFSRDSWFDVKHSFGLDFPNLPYYIDGDFKLTQSNAILRHLARKHNLYGETLKEQAQVDLLLDQIMDLRNCFAKLCYGPEFNDKLRDEYISETKPKLRELETFLGDKQFFVGDKPTACDFHIYEMLDVHKIFEPSILQETPKLSEYLQRFEELPNIKAYMASQKFISRPINNKCAQFV